MEFLRKIVNRNKRESKDVDYPNEFTLEQCISELTGDGFTVSSALRDDVARFGLVEGIVLAMDGNSGLRVVNWNGEGLVIKTFNGLRDGKDLLSKLARVKYDSKPIHL
ncbi:MAG TPA: hypothetical protein PKJ26_00915 [Candidatus Woesebacteria bacterium]|nr:hypothetical protein [Candidatus Woesebacteria bacterium]HNS65035.1 hypothetical protein [Candidatus Woesebacteria bacterium]